MDKDQTTTPGTPCRGVYGYGVVIPLCVYLNRVLKGIEPVQQQPISKVH